MDDFPQDVIQTLTTFGQPPRIVPRSRMINTRDSAATRCEPDSGISSARSTTTVPWSQNESEIPPLPLLKIPNLESGEAEHQF